MNERIPTNFCLSNLRIVLFSLLLVSCAAYAQAAEKATVHTTYPGLTSGILGKAVLDKNMGPETLLAADTWQITEEELQKAVDKQPPALQSQLPKNLVFILEQEVMGRVLAEEAQKAGITAADNQGQEQLIRQLFANTTAAITVADDKIRAFYEANREMVDGASFESVKDSMEQYLLQEKKQQVFSSYISTVTNALQLRINAEWVAAQHGLAMDNPVDRARRSNTPTMVEFGATGCVPCDMMQPILDNLQEKHGDRLNVVFVHVGEEQILAARYGIGSIPVQVFFDAQGREVFRHTGFFAEEEVVKQLALMGVEE
ncbi:MAG: thioredoxin domain-containing protein [Desulfopila sp.]